MSATPRIVVLHDQDAAFGPYLFLVTDDNLSTSAAAAGIDRLVRDVKDRLPEEYQFNDLLVALRLSGLGVEEAQHVASAEEVW